MVRRTTTNIESVEWNIARLDEMRERSLNSTEKRCILRTYYGMYAEAYYNNRSHTYSAVNSRIRTANLLGRAKSTVSNLVTNWIKASRRSTNCEHSYSKKSIEATQYGNFLPKPKKMPHNTQLLSDIRELVLQHRNDRKKIMAREVILYLIQNSIVFLRRNNDTTFDKLEFNSSLRSVQRYLKYHGFKRGKKTNTVHLNPDHIA